MSWGMWNPLRKAAVAGLFLGAAVMAAWTVPPIARHFAHPQPTALTADGLEAELAHPNTPLVAGLDPTAPLPGVTENAVAPGETPDALSPEEEGVAPEITENIGPTDPSSPPGTHTGAPHKHLDDCEAFFTSSPDDSMRLRERENLIHPHFTVTFRGLINPYPLMSLMGASGELVDVEIRDGEGTFSATARGGAVAARADGRGWAWTLPDEPGVYCLKIAEQDSEATMCLHGIVTVPYSGEDSIEGYAIGEYESIPMRDSPRYEMPKGLIRVTEDELDTWVSPHLRLGQFACKQSGGFPKFMLLETRLLLKLEAIVSDLAERDISPDTLYVTSGYRTPYYNRQLGNQTNYSRHLYGDAADIFIDKDGDYRLDDLNGDGKTNNRDALFLSSIIEDVSGTLPEFFRGGLGFYGFNSQRTAFVHTDTRGYVARWGFPSSSVAAGPPVHDQPQPSPPALVAPASRALAAPR